MMGQQKSGPELFNYAVNLEKRVRSDHVLRRVEAAIDFGFVREEVAHCYGDNGNDSLLIINRSREQRRWRLPATPGYFSRECLGMIQ